MYLSHTFFPRQGDTPSNRMCGIKGNLPVLHLGTAATDVELQWNPEDYDAAVVYLDTLADEATSLATKIRQHQLLAAVEETPHDPQRAEQIRAAYEGAQ